MNKIYSLKYSYITGGLIAVSELCKNVKKRFKNKHSAHFSNCRDYARCFISSCFLSNSKE